MVSAADRTENPERPGRSGRAGAPAEGTEGAGGPGPARGRRSGSGASARGAQGTQSAESGVRSVRTSVWQAGGRPERGRRSAQPASLDRRKIVDTAVRLLDAEGAAKFSMRRLAAELDVTAMSVYWYVDNKDDLLEYALDAVYGDIRLPDVSDPAQWREQLRTLATEYRSLLVRHPWTSGLVGHFLNIGPNSVSFVLAAHQAIRNAGLPPEGQIGGIAAIYQFVYGFGTIEGHFVAHCTTAGISQDEYVARAMGTVNALPELSEYAEAAAEMMDARGGTTVAEMRDRDFDFALEMILAGVEAMVARADRAG
ncbi:MULTISPECIES: TetR/AcrR family transcriptional regulator [Streptomyces]|uniref:TetR/AcrR family transcriptional regulator n=1 Tax=Streptomyces tsukubensis (strain DSM 42081 / NBRC 108919 / NRRL 18488 / 9993) TaxID=1114943 RepID=I2N1P2_STRT9|nr:MULTISPECIES: TetR/AcrR family transcriptional regulator [Streptomyces]AZK95100.1 TetR family transcriptional regulator [Streptomyces tsukubensis]EIF90939.1 TetR family transcriptional regulator [Streptomyces tsukubensis NRRL18488]MYS64173.1 TetR family transcriptional regulator [Streptomyces sp. SID5473]QKM68834.1 TetR/AcrR family transcriptional regulator [Streptomyces tsukubensis NRRL18488]TAI43639.1 TetR/AcrR family transcriptional regulator [Streptomyces tsukubensis]